MIDDLFRRRPLALVGSDVRDASEARTLQRATGTEVERLRRGVYAHRAQWVQADSIARHRLSIDAVAATRRGGHVIAHASAAVVWGIPIPLARTMPVHTILEPTSGVRSGNGVVIHRQQLSDDDVHQIDGLLVTSPVRTVLDLARTLPSRDAVVALDFVIHPRRPQRFRTLARELLDEQLKRSGSRRGLARATRAVEFARPGADNPGETISRVIIHELGFPPPMLQVRHPNPRGGSYLTDTEWPEYKTIGEFDGKGKYLKEEYLYGMTPGDAVYEEKIREDHLRDEHNTVARWGWPELRDPPLLLRKLLAAGLPHPSRRAPRRL